MNRRAKSTQSNSAPNSFMQQNERKASRTRSPRGRNPRGRMYRLPCKDYLKGTCTGSFCEKRHPPECLFYKTKSGCRFGEKCSHEHRQVDEQPCRSLKRMVTEVQWLCWRSMSYTIGDGETRCLPWHTSRAPRTCCVQLIKDHLPEKGSYW